MFTVLLKLLPFFGGACFLLLVGLGVLRLRRTIRTGRFETLMYAAMEEGTWRPGKGVGTYVFDELKKDYTLWGSFISIVSRGAFAHLRLFPVKSTGNIQQWVSKPTMGFPQQHVSSTKILFMVEPGAPESLLVWISSARLGALKSNPLFFETATYRGGEKFSLNFWNCRPDEACQIFQVLASWLKAEMPEAEVNQVYNVVERVDRLVNSRGTAAFLESNNLPLWWLDTDILQELLRDFHLSVLTNGYEYTIFMPTVRGQRGKFPDLNSRKTVQNPEELYLQLCLLARLESEADVMQWKNRVVLYFQGVIFDGEGKVMDRTDWEILRAEIDNRRSLLRSEIAMRTEYVKRHAKTDSECSKFAEEARKLQDELQPLDEYFNLIDTKQSAVLVEA